MCIGCWTQGLYLSTADISADKLILHFLLLLSLKSHNRSVQSLGIKTSDKQVLVSVLNFSWIDQIHFSTSLIRCLSKEESNIHSKPQVIKIDLEVGNLQMFPFTEGDVRCCLVYFCLFQKLVPSDKQLLCLLPLYCCQCHIICKDRYLYHCGLSSASSESSNYHLLHCSTFCVLWDEYYGRGRETGMTSWVKQGWFKMSKAWFWWIIPGMVEKWIRHAALVTEGPQNKTESMVKYKGNNSRSCLTFVIYLSALLLGDAWL